jgi:hypothetical protein
LGFAREISHDSAREKYLAVKAAAGPIILGPKADSLLLSVFGGN